MAAVLRPFSSGLRGRFSGQFVPGGGIPRIDWTHPLTAKLSSYWWPVSGGSYIDLVTGDVTKAGTGSKNVLPVSGASRYGPAPNFSTTTTMCESSRTNTTAIAAPYTIACGIYQLATSVGVAAGVFGVADASGNDPYMVFYPATTTLGISYANTTSPFSFTYTNNTFYVLVGAATGAAAQSSYVNGLAQTAGTATSAFTPSAASGFTFGEATYNSSLTTINPNMILYFGAVWTGRALTQAEATLLYTDPYCFLLPAESEMPALFVGVTAFTMTAATGNYSLTQEQEKLLRAALDKPQAGFYALTPDALLNINKGSKVSIQEGAYVLTGEQITALKKSVQNIQEVPYTTNSQPVLKKTSLQNIQEVPYTLTPDSLLNINKGSKAAIQEGAYALAGEQVTALKKSLDKIQTGTYATSSQPVLKKASLLSAQEVSYALNTGSGVDDARSFNGTSDIVTIGTPAVLDITSNITLACWVYANSLPASGANFVEFLEKGYDGVNQQYFLRFAGENTGGGTTGNYITVGTFAPANGADLLNVAVTNTWMHIAGTYDGTHWNLYFNGSNSGQVQTGTSPPVHAAAQVSFGGAYISGSPARFLNGNMADVAIWNTNLTGTQISNLAAGRRANTVGANANLVGYWPIFGQSPEPDKSGNGNNGTLTGTAVVSGPPALDPFGTTILGNETLLWDHLLNAQMTPYALTGESLTFAFSGSTAFSISIGTGVYSLTDETLTLTKTSRAGLQTGVYNLTDEQLTLLHASRLVNTSGFYSFTGEQITLKAARLDKVQSGFYSLTGENERLLKTSRTSAQTGFYNLTGENETLRRGATAFTQAGFYALTGENAFLRATRLLSAQMTPYSLTGENLTLSIPAAATAAITTAFLLGMGPFAGNAFGQLPTGVTAAPITSFTISIGAGTYTVAVENEALIATRREALQAGFYSLAGGSLTITTAFPGQFTVSIGTGTYSLTDESLTLVKTSRQRLQVATYSLTDEALQTLKGSKLANTSGTYTLTGEALKLNAGHLVVPQTGFYNFTSALTSRKKSLLNSAAGFYVVQGSILALATVAHGIILSTPTLLGLDAQASLLGGDTTPAIKGQDANATLTGQDANVNLLGQDSEPALEGEV